MSEAIGFELGLPKCSTAHMLSGRISSRGNADLPSGRTIAECGRDGSYKYLGVDQLMAARPGKVKARVGKEYIRRVRKTWSSKLNSRKKVQVHNQWCTSVLRYFLGVVHWSRRDLVGLDRATRKIMRASRTYHRNSALERLYLPREEGGRGLQGVEMAWEREIASTAVYAKTSQDPQVREALELDKEMGAKGLKSLDRQAREVVGKYGLDPVETYATPREVTREITRAQEDALRETWCGKLIHGAFGKQIIRPQVDRKATHAWLKDGRLQARSESMIVAMQDHTRAYRHRILKEPGVSPTCRRCEENETLGHVVSRCKVYDFTLYKDRHDRMLFQLVKGVARALKIAVPGYLKNPGGKMKAGVMGREGRTQLYVDQLIPTDRTMTNRRPDLVVKIPSQDRIIIMEVQGFPQSALARRRAALARFISHMSGSFIFFSSS